MKIILRSIRFYRQRGQVERVSNCLDGHLIPWEHQRPSFMI